jgi:transglutaminase-like putative cysteine protease
MTELLGRLVRWFIRLIGGMTLMRLLLLAVLLVCVERGLIAIVGHILTQWLAASAIFALIFGWILGRSRIPWWGCALFAMGAGLIWLIISVGQMSSPIDTVILAFPPLLKQIIFHNTPEWTPLLVAWTALVQDFQALLSRLILWMRNAGTSTLIIDPGITSLVWGLALWLVATWAGWWVRRRDALGVGLLPATILLIYNVYYTNSKHGIVWLVLVGGAWIILQAVDSYNKARRRWQQQHMGQTEIEPVLAGVVTLLAIGLMVTGGLIPSISIQKISDAFQNFFKSQQNGNLAESLGLQQTPATASQGRGRGTGLSDIHPVGPGPHLSQDILMYVTVDGYIPPPPPEVLLHIPVLPPAVRYYWRSQTFDSFNGHVWVANPAKIQEMAANTPYYPDLVILPENYHEIHQHIERLQPMDGALFTTGDLMSTDQASIAVWRDSGDLVDAQTNADSYTAISRLQSVSVEQLRLAGNNYPASVRRYQSLPDELPGRVRDLAIRLTIEQPTPYDQVMAIQNYLRQFPYSLEVPGPPTDRDVADYFLFDLQKGYCDYFATTMAVMVRAIGIPARLVTGFSSGNYDYDAGRFVVVQSNAHAWVEVYFPGIGWVEFEPTANQLPFTRPGEISNQETPVLGIPNPLPGTGPGQTWLSWKVFRQPLLILGFGLAGLVIIFLLLRLLPFESWLLTLRPTDKALTAIQHRLYRLGRSWGIPANAARTPHEFASVLLLKLDRFSGNPRLAQITADLQSNVNWLTGLYARLLFSPNPPTREEHLQAVRYWEHVRKGIYKIRN